MAKYNRNYDNKGPVSRSLLVYEDEENEAWPEGYWHFDGSRYPTQIYHSFTSITVSWRNSLLTAKSLHV